MRSIFVFSEVKEGELENASSSQAKKDGVSSLSLVKKQFTGRYAISSDEFTNDMVSLAGFQFLVLISMIINFIVNKFP